ncbi:MAG: RNA repair domain-containing protein [Sulfolobales archaeon]|nr:RNA repair domain-containing protein [Sulfolobales archaeon]MDW8010884.1 RNA repair domain-containing protein [Sulfolobales archaeon]
MGKVEAREVLKKLFWMARSGELNLADVEIVVIDRITLSGVRGIKLSESSILMKDRVIVSESGAQIPMHRVVEVRVRGETLWRRESARAKS